jgi:hypothetical protein
MLSALAPVYVLYVRVAVDVPIDGYKRTRQLYSSFPAQFEDREGKMAALIEETFHFTRLTEETLLLPVPDVVPRSSNLLMGQARLIDCLFTTHR